MNYRHQLVDAVTWKIIAELMRRHAQQSQLRVFETHPGGGQYDCLDLRQGYENLHGKHLCDFHGKGNHLHIWIDEQSHLFEWRGNDDYISTFLELQDPKILIDEIEKQIGLLDRSEKSIPATTPPVLVYRIISETLQRFIFSRDWLLVECGWFDSSYDCHVREELMHFTAIKDEFEQDRRPSARFQLSSRFWMLSLNSKRKPQVVLDLNGMAYFQSNPDNPWNIMNAYKQGKRVLSPILDKIYTELMTLPA